MSPVYSIIIPHRNTPLLLRRLLQSIPARTDTEIIVIDDCSGDEYLPELARLKEEFSEIGFLSTPSRQWPAGARNQGIRNAKGKYLLFADADDFFLPAFNEVLTDYATTDFDIVFCNAQSVDSATLQPANRAEYFPRLLNRFLISGNIDDIRVAFAVVWGRLISRSLVVDNNISFEPVEVNEDVMFSTLIGIAAKNVTADLRPIYCVTAREGTMSTLLTREAVIQRLKITIARNSLLVKSGFCHLKGDPSLLHHFLEIDRAAIPGLKKEAIEICRQAGYSTWLIRRRLAIFKLRSALSRLLHR